MKKIVIQASFIAAESESENEIKLQFSNGSFSDDIIERVDGKYKINCLKTEINNEITDKKISKYIKISELEKIYEESKTSLEKFTPTILLTGDQIPFTNVAQNSISGISKIKIDILREKIFSSDDLKSDEDITLEIFSECDYFYDFWWEDLVKDKTINVIRTYNGNKVAVSSDDALILISRSREGETDLKDSIIEEANDFSNNFFESFIDNKRKNIINKVHIEYFKKVFPDNYDNLVLLHVTGHGDDNGAFLAEDENTEGSPDKGIKINRDSFISMLNGKKIDILNLSFCNSSINYSISESSLPLKLLKGNIANYVIASKKRLNTDEFVLFNKFFYGNFFKKSIEESFVLARNQMKDKTCLSLFKLGQEN